MVIALWLFAKTIYFLLSLFFFFCILEIILMNMYGQTAVHTLAHASLMLGGGSSGGGGHTRITHYIADSFCLFRKYYNCCHRRSVLMKITDSTGHACCGIYFILPCIRLFLLSCYRSQQAGLEGGINLNVVART